VWRVSTFTTNLAGHRVTTTPSVVTRLYRAVCGTILIKYDHPVTTACPAAIGMGTYHLTFRQRLRVLLGVSERDEGCTDLTVDGHSNLGSGFGVLYLPPGVPSVMSATGGR
jgi:hypothetical protein